MLRAQAREATRAQQGAATDAGSGAPASFVGQAGAMAQKLTPPGGMAELFFSWGQFSAIFGDLTSSVTSELSLSFPALDLESVAPWTSSLGASFFPLLRVFNLDMKSLQLSLNLAFLSMIGWRETHLAFTVIVPLIVSALTIVLLRSLADIGRLLILAGSILLLIFGGAAYAILGVASALRGEAVSQILDLNTTSLAYVAVSGAVGVFLACVLYALKWHATHKKIRLYLQTEVDELAEKLHGVKEGINSAAKQHKKAGGGGRGGGAGGGAVQESLPNASRLTKMLEEHTAEDEGLIGGRAKNSAEFLKQMEEKQIRRVHGHGPRMPQFSSFVKTIVLWMVASAAALFFWLRHFEVLPEGALQSLPDTHQTLYHVLAVALSILSGVILLYECMSLTPSGQSVLDGIFQFLKAAYIGVLIILVNFLYLPISRQALSVFICDTHDCASGEWFPLQSPGSEASLWTYLTQFGSKFADAAAAIGAGANESTAEAEEDALMMFRPAEACTACFWLGNDRDHAPLPYWHNASVSAPGYEGVKQWAQGLVSYGGGSSCPAHLAADLCPGGDSSRLASAPQIDCDQQLAFYLPGTLLTILMFTVGVPYLFYTITHRHTEFYDDLDIYQLSAADRNAKKQAMRKGRLSQRTKEALFTPVELEDIWQRRVQNAGRNRAKNLYSFFKYQWRYWKLIRLGEKFLIVVVDVLKTKLGHPAVAPILMLAIHSCMLMLGLFARPYENAIPNMLSIAISAANVFNYCLLLTTAVRVASPPSLVYGILFVNVGVPLLAIPFGWWLNVRHKRRMAAELQQSGNKRAYVATDVVQKKRRLVERQINEFTLRQIASWTWGVLIASIVAGELIFIGTFAEAALTPVSGHTATTGISRHGVEIVDCFREEHARNQEFLGFGNWSAFTDNCCCMARANVTAGYTPWALKEQVTELWTCKNTIAMTERERRERPIIYKERQRRALEPGSRVHRVRHFCDTVFRDQYGFPIGQEPSFDDATGKLGIYWYNDDGTVLTHVDDYW